MMNEDEVLKTLLNDVLTETRAMIDHDPSPEGRRLARQYALTEPGCRITVLESASSKK